MYVCMYVCIYIRMYVGVCEMCEVCACLREIDCCMCAGTYTAHKQRELL